MYQIISQRNICWDINLDLNYRIKIKINRIIKTIPNKHKKW